MVVFSIRKEEKNVGDAVGRQKARFLAFYRQTPRGRGFILLGFTLYLSVL